MSAILIIYLKFLNKKSEYAKENYVKPYANESGKWIYFKYKEIQQNMFVNSQDYFPSILRDYYVC